MIPAAPTSRTTRALRGLRAVRAKRALVLCALVACVAVGFGLRAQQAASPVKSLSADERAYGRIALALSTGEGYGDPGMRDPYQWAPGAPVLFSLARRLGPNDRAAEYRVSAAYWAQAIAGTLLILAAFALAALLAGELAGLAAAAAVAFYPPLIDAAGNQLSEPLGALALVAACAALAWAWRRPRFARLVLCGVLFGATVLTRADLLLVPLLATVAVAAAIPLGAGVAGRVRGAATILCAALAVIVPWVVVASNAEGRLVPVSDGGASALFIGTYLPGGGTIAGLKRKLAAETRVRVPVTRHVRALQIPAEKVLLAVSLRRPREPPRVALRDAARRNIDVYAFGRPGAFASMMASKAARMWWQPTRAGRVPGSDVVLIHRVLLVLAVLGLLAGLWRRRDPVAPAILAIVLYSTLDNAILIAEARHNLPLLPLLYAAGAAGWAIAIRERGRSPAPATPSPH